MRWYLINWSRFGRSGGYGRKWRLPLWLKFRTAGVEVLGQTQKAVKIKNKKGQIAWIPKRWILKKKELGAKNWKIKIRRFHWAKKFS